MQYLLDHIAGQTRLLYVGESVRVALLQRLPVALVHQRNRIVAARDQVIGAECLAGTSKRKERAMSYGVVPKSLRGDARFFGQVLVLSLIHI